MDNTAQATTPSAVGNPQGDGWGVYGYAPRTAEAPQEDSVPPEAVAAMKAMQRGDMTPEEADKVVVKAMVAKDFWGMAPEDAKAAWEYGFITDKQAEAYLDYNENPIAFHFKDKAKAVTEGVLKAANEMMVTAHELITAPSLQYRGLMALAGTNDRSLIEKTFPLDEAAAAVKPDLPSSELVSTFAQFGAGFAVETKALHGLSSAVEVPAALTYVKDVIGTNFPKVAPFLENIIVGASKGMLTSAAAFDPKEKGFMDLLDQYPSARPFIIDYLKTDPNDPEPEARMKKALEGFIMGVHLEMMVAGLKVFKNRLFLKHQGDADAIAKEAEEVAAATSKIDTPFPQHPEDFPPREVTKDAVVGTLREDYAFSPMAEFPKHPDDFPPRTVPQEASEKEIAGAFTKDEATGAPVGATPDGPRTSKASTALDSVPEATKAIEAYRALRDAVGADITGVGKPIDPHVKGSALNLAKFSGEEISHAVLQVINDQQVAQADELMKAKGGVRTLGKLESKVSLSYSHLSDLDEQTLINRLRERVVVPMSQMESYLGAMGDLVATLTDKAISLYKEAHAAGDVAGKVEATRVAMLAGDIQRYLDYGATQSGRLLQSLQRMNKVRESRGELIQELVDSGVIDQMDEGMKALTAVKSLKEKAKLTRKLAGNRFMDGLLEYVQATLVYGIETNAVNLVGNTIALGWDTLVHHAGVLGYALHTKEFSALKEISAYWHGLSQALTSGLTWKRVGTAFKTGEGQLDSLQKFGRNSVLKTVGPKIPWLDMKLGDVYITAFRFLAMEDEFFKNIAYHARREALIYRHGIDLMSQARHMSEEELVALTQNTGDLKGQMVMHKTKGIHGFIVEQDHELGQSIVQLPSGKSEVWATDDLRSLTSTASDVPLSVIAEGDVGKLMVHMRENLPEGIHYQALQAAREVTFTAPMTGIYKSIVEHINTPGVLQFFGKPFHSNYLGIGMRIAFMPFASIVQNMMRFTLDRTPMKILGAKFNEGWLAGGVSRAEAAARVASGILPFTLGATLAAQGKITGFIDADMDDISRASGIQPYALLDMDSGEALSYMRAQPVAFLVAMGACAHQITNLLMLPDDVQDEINNLPGKIARIALDPIISQSWMKSLQDFVHTFWDGKVRLDKFTTSQANKFIPFSSLIDQVQKDFFDDYVRDTWDAWDLIRRKLHGMPGVEPPIPKVNPVYGSPIENYRKGDWRVFLGANPMKIADDPGMRALLRFGVNVQPIGDTLTFAGESYKFKSAEEYMHFQNLLNKTGIQENLRAFVESDGFAQMSADPKLAKTALSSFITSHREAAKAAFFSGNTEALSSVQEKALRRVEAVQQGESLSNPASSKYGWVDKLLGE